MFREDYFSLNLYAQNNARLFIKKNVVTAYILIQHG